MAGGVAEVRAVTGPFPWSHIAARVGATGAIVMVCGLPISITVFGIGSALMVLGWLISGRLANSWTWIKSSTTGMSITTVTLIAILGLVGTHALTPYVLTLLGGYLSLLLAVLLAYYLQDSALRRYAWNGLAVSALFTLACTYLGIWYPVPWAFSQARGWGADHSVMGVYLSQSMFFTFIGWWAVVKSVKAGASLQKVAFAIFGLASFFSVLFLTRGRAGFVALLASCAVVAIFGTRGRLRAIILSAGAAALVGGVFSPVLGPALSVGFDELLRFLSPQEASGSWDSRVAMSWFAVQAILDAPILGHGLGSYRELASAWFQSPALQNFPHAHNQFLMSWLEFGIAGLAAWIAIFWGVWRDSLHGDFDHRILVLVLLALFFVDGMTDSSTWLANKRNVFVVFIGLMTATSISFRTVKVPPVDG